MQITWSILCIIFQRRTYFNYFNFNINYLILILIILILILIILILIILILLLIILILIILILILIILILIILILILIILILILIILILAPTRLSLAILLPSSIRSLRVCFVVVRRSDQPRSSCRLAEQGEWTLDTIEVLVTIDHENVLVSFTVRNDASRTHCSRISIDKFDQLHSISYLLTSYEISMF